MTDTDGQLAPEVQAEFDKAVKLHLDYQAARERQEELRLASREATYDLLSAHSHLLPPFAEAVDTTRQNFHNLLTRIADERRDAAEAPAGAAGLAKWGGGKS